MQVSNMKLHGNLQWNPRWYMRTDRRTNIKQNCVPASVQTRKKNSCDSRSVRRTRQHFGCVSLKSVKKKNLFCCLPTRVLKDVYTCQLHVILSHKHHSLHFVQIVNWPPIEISEQQRNVRLWPYFFLNLHFSSYCER